MLAVSPEKRFIAKPDSLSPIQTERRVRFGLIADLASF